MTLKLFSKPRLTMEPTDIFEGDRFKLTCSVSIYVPDRIHKEDMQFSIYKDNVMVTSEETLVAVAGSSKNGNYSCRVQVSSGHTFVKGSQTVAVKAKIPVSEPKLSVVGGTLVLGKHFQLLCHSRNGTLPITYTLHSPGGRSEHRMVRKPGEQAIFNSSIIYLSSDLSNFLCLANNSEDKPPLRGLGQQLLRSTNIIEPVSKPHLIIHPSADGISEGQDVTLICSVQRGTPPITFMWYHNGTERALASQNSKKQEGSYKISNVRGEHRGPYYCEGRNTANESKRSDIVMIGVKMAGWKRGLIAVFCVLFILAVILVITFKRRLLLFKRKRTRELSVKSAGTKVERLSLTLAEVRPDAANVTPGMMGKSIWSEHVSGSESDDQLSVTSPEKQEPQYTEVQTRQADPNRAPVKKGTDTVYSEVRNSKQGVPEQADGTQREDVCCDPKGKNIQVRFLPPVAVVTESEWEEEVFEVSGGVTLPLHFVHRPPLLSDHQGCLFGVWKLSAIWL
ncbi:hypothetical protein L3Q82_014347 [Scortum barcoo]|uniref:Uncharacterized protein n=1 Tax=Scortum barcoo TaxID=214431 RepID=A0ACB8VX00_9TELE|nr:hypothetical protein L3Q82_014347 [Scortum barcoo]